MNCKWITLFNLIIVMLHPQGTNGFLHTSVHKCTQVYSCEWEQWGIWSSCSAPCGTHGTSTRTRDVTVGQMVILFFQKCGVRDCFKPAVQTEPCNRFCKNGGKSLSMSCDCRGLPFYGICCQFECVKSSWGAWGKCSATCETVNGVMSRSRQVASTSICSSYGKETKTCQNICGERECVTGSWGKWSECSGTCEKRKGTTFRSRAVLGSPVCTSYGKEEKKCRYRAGNKCGEHGDLDRYGNCECDYLYYGKCCEKRRFDSRQGYVVPASPPP